MAEATFGRRRTNSRLLHREERRQLGQLGASEPGAHAGDDIQHPEPDRGARV